MAQHHLGTPFAEAFIPVNNTQMVEGIYMPIQTRIGPDPGPGSELISLTYTPIDMTNKEKDIFDKCNIADVSKRHTELKEAIKELEGIVSEYKKQAESISNYRDSISSDLVKLTGILNYNFTLLTAPKPEATGPPNYNTEVISIGSGTDKDMLINLNKELNNYNDTMTVASNRKINEIYNILMDLSQKIHILQTEYAHISKFIYNGLAANNKITEITTNTCSICLVNNVSACINPCGHTYCGECLSKLSRCPMCQGSITSVIKIFLN